MKRAALVAMTFLLLLPVLAAEPFVEKHYTLDNPIEDSKPLIKVYFGERPVEILDQLLLREGETLETRSTDLPGTDYVTLDQRHFNFTLERPTDNLPSGDYIFYAKAYDTNYNRIDIYVHFTIDADDNPLYLLSPENPFDVEPTFAMADTQTFDLTIGLAIYPAQECRWGLTLPTGRQPADIYNSQYVSTIFTQLSPFSSHDEQMMQFTVEGFTGLANRNVLPGILVDLYVICKDPDYDDGQGRWDARVFGIGWDDTPPNFLEATGFYPEEITDLSRRNVTMIVQTDDMTYCTYVNTFYGYGTTSLGSGDRYIFDTPSLDGREDFNTSRSLPMGFFGANEEPDINTLTAHYPGPYTYKFDVTCANIAGMEETIELTLPIEFDDEIIIEKISPEGEYANSNSATFTFSTNLQASCTLTMDGEQHELANQGFNEDGRQLHEETISGLDPGTHEYTVRCIPDAVDVSYAEETYQLITDNVKPTKTDLAITLEKQVLCGEDRYVQATANATDNESGIETYRYTITGGGNDIEGEADDGEINEPVEAKEGDTFTLTAWAVDMAGNEGAKTSAQVPYHASTHQACDRTPPTTWADDPTPRPAGDGYDIKIQCSDEGTGCDTAVKLYVAPAGEPCSDNQSLYAESQTVNKTFHITDNGLLCWFVKDKGVPPNIGFGSRGISANVGIEVIEPSFGISPNKTFTLTVQTLKNADCRQGAYIPTAHDGKTGLQHYNDLVARGAASNFTTTGGTTHTIPVFSALSRAEAEYEADWLFACKSADLYTSTMVRIGYDTTPPVINITLNPNPLREPSETSTDLAITVDEDSLCTYLQPTASPYSPPPFTYNFNDPLRNSHWDLSNRQHYTSLYNTRLPEDDNRYFTIAASYAYSYTVKCTNLAGRIAQKGFDVQIDPLQKIAVNFHTKEYLKAASVLFNATTIGRAECTLSVEGLEPIEMDTGDDYYHTKTVTLQDGSYDADVTCVSSISTQLQSGAAHKTIHVDTKPPTQTNLTAPQATCGLAAKPVIKISVADPQPSSGFDHYEVSITLGTNTSVINTSQEQFTLPVKTPMTAGATITVKARPIDKAGNAGPWSAAATIKATDENDLLCDETNPTGWVSLQDTASGAEATVHCTDGQSGCTAQYGYVLIDKDESCDGASYQQKAYGQTVAITQDKLLCWRVADLAGNAYQGQTDITVSLSITLQAPAMGIESNKTYDLVYATDRAASCRVGVLNPNHPSDLADWQGQLQENLATGGSTHTYNDFSLTAFGVSCASQPECTAKMVIICAENARYHYTVDDIGFDATAPSLEAWAAPNPVIEPGALQSTLHAESDDEVWCSYEGAGESYAFYQYPDPTDLSQYLTEHEKSLGYLPPPPSGQTSYTTTYTVTCKNLAQTAVTKDVVLTVAPTNTIGITITTPAEHGTKTIPVNATTDLQADCDYKLDPNQPAKPFTTTGGTTHKATASVNAEGEYEIIVHCEAVSGPYEATASKAIIVDATGPVMLGITTNDKSCGLTSLSATLAANASIIGLKAYNYTITDQQQNVLVAWKTTTNKKVSESIDLVDGAKYTIQAQAIDKLGRKSTIISKTITASDENDAACDEEPPVASMEVQDVYGGVRVYVECDDDQSGCTSYYDFLHAQLGSADTCENGSYDSQPYTARPISLSTSGEACAIVYDQAANEDRASESFTIIEHCANGIQDANEDGVDCGGPCPASCETCNNGRKDPTEDGVDCGGVCPKTCIDTCGNGRLDAGEECDATSTRASCTDLGFESGTTTCTEECTIDTAACKPATNATCGNGKVETGEQCDGGVKGLTCEDFGLGSGSLSCTACKITTTGCTGQTGTCGDGVIGAGETCDKGFQGLTCEDFGLRSGTLNCQACQIVTNACHQGTCGDGVIDPSETCDGLNWGEVEDCSGVSDLFVSGTPVCGPDCHFDTGMCVAKEGQEEPPEPGEPGSLCLQDDDCNPGYECKDNACAKKAPPKEGEACTAETGCEYGYECVDGECVEKKAEQSWPTEPEKSHKTGKILLFSGLFLIIAGGAFLAVDAFIRPIGPRTPFLGGTMPQQPLGPDGMPAREPPSGPMTAQDREEALAQERRKLALQQQAKAKAQLEKAKEREGILSSFKDPDKKQGGDDMDSMLERLKEKSKPKDAAKPQTDVQKPAEQPAEAPKAAQQPKADDVFAKLEKITKDEGQKAPLKEEPFKALSELTEKPTNKEIFDHLSTITGAPLQEVRQTLSRRPTADELTELFDEAKKKDINHKTVAPALTHLIRKGKIEQGVAHQTVQKLAEQKLLTPSQKQKILDELGTLGDDE